MDYTIKDAAARMHVSPHTLRYYDKEGLLPFMERGAGGVRRFRDSDLGWLSMIECLKASGMPIKDIRQFIDWCMAGDETLTQRLHMFYERRQAVQAQMAKLQETLKTIEYKCSYYEAAVAAGTEAIHRQRPCGAQAEQP